MVRLVARGLALLLFLGLLSGLWAWGGYTHKRMTYWGWKHARMPASSGSVSVPVVWNMDSIETVLGFETYDIFSLLTYLFVNVGGASFDINVQPVPVIASSVTDSALFTEWGRKPDDFDAPSAAAGGALWGHMYIPAGGGFADGMCAYFFNKAVNTYKANPAQLRKAYAYLALACHYLEDVGFPPHNEKNYLDPSADIWQAAYHEKIEDLIGDSLFWFTNFDTLCDRLARNPLPVYDPVIGVHGLAWEGAWFDEEFKDAAKKNDKTDLIRVCRKCIQLTMPRVAGLFYAFKLKTGLP